MALIKYWCICKKRCFSIKISGGCARLVSYAKVLT